MRLAKVAKAAALTLGALFALFVLLIITLEVLSNIKVPRKPPVPTTERDELERRFPFLGKFERCSWVWGVDGDPPEPLLELLPSQESLYIRAYVVLAPDDVQRLTREYEWTEAVGKPIPEPGYPLGEGFPKIAGPFLESEGLNRSLTSMTSYNWGTVLLQPDGGLAYLDLVRP